MLSLHFDASKIRVISVGIKVLTHHIHELFLGLKTSGVQIIRIIHHVD
jgi:hypothetical protein